MRLAFENLLRDFLVKLWCKFMLGLSNALETSINKHVQRYTVRDEANARANALATLPMQKQHYHLLRHSLHYE